MRVAAPGGSSKMIRRSGSAEFDTKLKMAREVKRRVSEIVGVERVAAAEMLVTSAAGSSADLNAASASHEQAASQEELQWLAESGMVCVLMMESLHLW